MLFFSKDDTALPPDPSKEEIFNWIEQAENNDTNFIIISGGEALLRDDVFEILDYGDSPKILITNATLLTKEKIKSLNKIKTLRDVKISLDGFTGHDMSRGNGTSDVVRKAISLVDEYGTFPYTIDTVVTNNNYLELIKLYEFICTTKCYRWEVDFPLLRGRAKEFVGVVKDKELMYKEVIAPLISRYLKDGKLFKLNMLGVIRWELFEDNHSAGFQTHTEDVHPCEYAMPSVSINNLGNVSFCPSLALIFGNIRKKNLSEILISEEYKKFINLKIKNLRNCSECKYIKLCGGGCRADALEVNKDITSIDKLSCERAILFEKYILPILPDNIRKNYGLLIESK